MKYFILSDIHSNLEAFQAVLEHTALQEEGEFIILGDLVGYGASPNETIEKILEMKPRVCIRGNHDKVVAGLETAEEFNTLAQIATDWTKRTLTEENRQFIQSLSKGPLDVDGEFLASHGSPLDEDNYVFTDDEAFHVFQQVDFNICFFGHTHSPVVYAQRGEKVSTYLPKIGSEKITMEEGVRYLLNPGSIGQPRDRIPKAGFALFDSEAKAVSFIRVPYRMDLASEKIIKAGLPSMLATRLMLGL